MFSATETLHDLFYGKDEIGSGMLQTNNTGVLTQIAAPADVTNNDLGTEGTEDTGVLTQNAAPEDVTNNDNEATKVSTDTSGFCSCYQGSDDPGHAMFYDVTCEECGQYEDIITSMSNCFFY